MKPNGNLGKKKSPESKEKSKRAALKMWETRPRPPLFVGPVIPYFALSREERMVLRVEAWKKKQLQVTS